MIESHRDKELDKKIDQYVNGQLSEEEIDELWAELIRDGEQLDYLKTVANTKAVIEAEKNKASIFKMDRTWIYAAAAVFIVVIAVLTVINFPVFQSTQAVKPISSIELEYYRSEEGVIASEPHQKVLKNALSMANEGNIQAAIELLQDELNKAETPSWQAELYLNIGSLQYNNGSYQQAIASFLQVVNKDVDVLTKEKGYWYLGNAYFQLNQLDDAKQAIRNAYELNGAYHRVAGSYLTALANK